MRLKEKLAEIEDKIESYVKGYSYTDNIENLSREPNIIMGNKERGRQAKPPLISIFFDNAEIEAVSGMSEEWIYNIVIIGLVTERDIDRGRQKATDLVSEASDVLMNNRTLDNACRDIQRTGFNPGDERAEIGNNVFGAGLQIQVKFRLRNN